MKGRAFDPKKIVADGYDRIAERYREWSDETRSEERARYTDLLLAALPAGAKVLDLGCGPGGRTTQRLADRFDVLGVDISPRSISLAREAVPNARFLCTDAATLKLADASFDAVAAFYSLIHLPRREQGAVLTRIAGWLRPGGLLVASFAVAEVETAFERDWLGAPMFWSGHGAERTRELLLESALEIIQEAVEVAEEFGEPVPFWWVVARKPERDSLDPVTSAADLPSR